MTGAVELVSHARGRSSARGCRDLPVAVQVAVGLLGRRDELRSSRSRAARAPAIALARDLPGERLEPLVDVGVAEDHALPRRPPSGRRRCAGFRACPPARAPPHPGGSSPRGSPAAARREARRGSAPLSGREAGAAPAPTLSAPHTRHCPGPSPLLCLTPPRRTLIRTCEALREALRCYCSVVVRSSHDDHVPPGCPTLPRRSARSRSRRRWRRSPRRRVSRSARSRTC